MYSPIAQNDRHIEILKRMLVENKVIGKDFPIHSLVVIANDKCIVDKKFAPKAIKELKKSNVDIKYIGSRHGEKINEVLITKEEMINLEDLGGYYRVPMDGRTLNYEECNNELLNKEIEIQEYNSTNTKLLNLKETIELLSKLDCFNSNN
mgnify:CR=1 FL=1